MKYRILITILSLVCINCQAADFSGDNAVLVPAKSVGTSVYYSCIVVPPASKAQKAFCNGLYSKYVANLRVVAAPSILGLSHEDSPYIESPYDVCKYDASHFVFNNPTDKPYCPVTNFIF